MKCVFYILISIFTSLLLSNCTKQKQLDRSPIIPQPQNLTFENGTFLFSDETSVYTNLEDHSKVLKWVKGLPIKEISTHKGSFSGSSVMSLILDTTICNNNQEAYSIQITNDSIIIGGASENALFYGIQNIIQLYNSYGYNIPALRIEDYPRFSTRGLMLDASSHYLSVDFIKKQIDMMARYKLNNLQLLLAGTGGWRIEIPNHRSLTANTAWRTHKNYKEWIESGADFCSEDTENAYGGFYTEKDIKDLVNYASERYVNITPAIDIPHSHKQLSQAAEIAYGDRDEKQLIADILNQIIVLFPSKNIYLGNGHADETHGTACPSCRSRVDNKPVTDEYEPYASILKTAEQLLNSNGRELIAWEESLRTGLTKNANIISWHNKTEGQTAAKRNYNVIMAPAEFMTLGYYQNDPTVSGEAISGFLPLEKVYAFNPVESNMEENQIKHITGIQANMWTQFTDEYSDIEMMLYPRLLAVAEVSWTLPQRKSYLDFKIRVNNTYPTFEKESYQTFDINTEKTIRPESAESFNSLAKNKAVQYNNLFHESFPANGVISLTDGLRGGWHYRDGRWQGFMGKNMSVIIDLENETFISYISATFVSDNTSKVYLPKEVHLKVSDDGENFQIIDTIRSEYSQNIDGYKLVDYTWQGKANARYILFEAVIGKPGTWLFTDEIIMR